MKTMRIATINVNKITSQNLNGVNSQIFPVMNSTLSHTHTHTSHTKVEDIIDFNMHNFLCFINLIKCCQMTHHRF